MWNLLQLVQREKDEKHEDDRDELNSMSGPVHSEGLETGTFWVTTGVSKK